MEIVEFLCQVTCKYSAITFKHFHGYFSGLFLSITVTLISSMKKKNSNENRKRTSSNPKYKIYFKPKNSVI